MSSSESNPISTAAGRTPRAGTLPFGNSQYTRKKMAMLAPIEKIFMITNSPSSTYQAP